MDHARNCEMKWNCIIERKAAIKIIRKCQYYDFFLTKLVTLIPPGKLDKCDNLLIMVLISFAVPFCTIPIYISKSKTSGFQLMLNSTDFCNQLHEFFFLFF